MGPTCRNCDAISIYTSGGVILNVTECSWERYQRQALTNHTKSWHLKYKEFTWEICSEPFSDRGSYSRHVWKHAERDEISHVRRSTKPRERCLHVPLFNPSKHNPSTINIPPNNVKMEIIADYPMYHRFMNQYFRTIEPKKNPVAGTILTNFWVWKIIDLGTMSSETRTWILQSLAFAPTDFPMDDQLLICSPITTVLDWHFHARANRKVSVLKS